MTVRLRFPQLKILKAIKLSFVKDDKSKGDVSVWSFNDCYGCNHWNWEYNRGWNCCFAWRSGVLCWWCWLTGVLGIATKYSEGLLAVKYRQKTEDGKMLGGPMYALLKRD